MPGDAFKLQPAREVMNRTMSERKLGQTIREMAEAYGWLCYQVLDTRNYAKRTSRGFPDQFIARPGRALALELKTERGIVTPNQELWVATLDSIPGITSAVIRPHDLDHVEELLRLHPRRTPQE